MSTKDEQIINWLDQDTHRLQDVYWHIENEGGTVREAADFLCGGVQCDPYAAYCVGHEQSLALGEKLMAPDATIKPPLL